MEIRVAHLADVPALFDIRTCVRENHQSVEELARLGITPATIAAMLQHRSRAWVAELAGKAIAFVMADAATRTIFALFVRPEFEGRGDGRRLMAQAESWLWAQDSTAIWLLTGSDPALRAYGFYQHLGWDLAGTTPEGQAKFVKPLP